MLVQEFLELIGIEIRQNPVACHECRDISLLGKLFHLFVCLSVFADVNEIETIAFLRELILCVNAPGAPLATVKP